MSRDTDSIRVLDDAPPAAEEITAKVQGGFGDTKKVVVLAVLALAGLSVVGYQFLGGKSPTTATAEVAVSPPLPGGAPNAAPAGVGAALGQLDAKPVAGAEDAISVAGVEELVRRFDTYVQDRQVPLGQLRVNPFQVIGPVPVAGGGDGNENGAGAPAAGLSAVASAAAAAEEAKAEAARKQWGERIARLTLGSVMMVDGRGMAVISGKLCGVGDRVGEFQVETIECERVVLTSNGQQVELRLRPKATAPEGV